MLKFNVSALERNVKPEIQKSKNYLEKAKNIIDSISVPSNFSYSEKIQKLSSNVKKTKNNIKSIEKWLDDSIKNLKKVEEQNKNLLNQLNTTISTNKSEPISKSGNNKVKIENDAKEINIFNVIAKASIENAMEFSDLNTQQMVRSNDSIFI